MSVFVYKRSDVNTLITDTRLIVPEKIVIVDISDLIIKVDCLDTFLLSMIVSNIQPHISLVELTDEIFKSVACFFSDCGYRSPLDNDEYSMVDRIVGLDNLYLATKIASCVLDDKFSTMFKKGFLDYKHVDWVKLTESVMEGVYNVRTRD